MWPHAATSVIGFWLLASPDLLQDAGTARMNNQIMGAWIVTFGLIAASESGERSAGSTSHWEHGCSSPRFFWTIWTSEPAEAWWGASPQLLCHRSTARLPNDSEADGLHSGKENRHDDRLVHGESRS